MKIFDLLGMCLRNMFKRKIRTILTLSGVILGSASVALTFAMGDAVKQNGKLMLESTGSLKSIYVYTGSMHGNDNKELYLDDKLIEKVKKIKGVESVLYDLPLGDNIMLAAGKNDKYKINYMDNIRAVDFVEMNKIGLKLKSNKPLDNKNYIFKISDKSIKTYSGQYFEYGFWNTQSKGYGLNSSRYDYSPVYTYQIEKYSKIFEAYGYTPDTHKETIPPFVDASKEKISLLIEYPNEKGSTNRINNLTDFDLNIDPFEDLKEQQQLYKYKRYDLLIEDRLDWDLLKDDTNLSDVAGNSVILDINTGKTLLKEARKLNKETPKKSKNGKQQPEFQYNNVIVNAINTEDVSNISKEIEKMGYQVYNRIKDIEVEQLRSKSNQFILGFLGGFALLVSAISISNTMVTSVVERTKEIGIIKVLGCKIGNIQIMFLLESALIGLIGGILGMFCSSSLSNFMNRIVGGQVENLGMFGKILAEYVEGLKGEMSMWAGEVTIKMAIVTPSLWILIILGTTLIGLIAGYFPSLTASRIEALRAIKSDK